MSSDTSLEPTEGIDVEQCTDPAEWNDFVLECDGPPFALWGWGEAAGVYGHDRHHLVVRDGQDVVAGVPLVYVRSHLFGSKLVSPPFGERASVLSSTGATRADERALLDRVRGMADDLGVDFVSLRGRKLREPAGYGAKRRFVTFRIPLGAESTMRERIKDSRDRQIGQAEGNPELTYDVGTSIDDLREYFRLYLRSVRGHGTPPHAFEFYETLWDRFHDAGQLHLGLVRRNGEPINGIINLALGSTVTQWGVVTAYEHRDLNGGSLLVWKSLQWAADRGHDAYELGRTREGSGVYLFKRSFGGEKTWYDDYHYFPDGEGTLPHPDDEQFEPAKRIWRRLPIPVTRLIGPSIRQSVTL